MVFSNNRNNDIHSFGWALRFKSLFYDIVFQVVDMRWGVPCNAWKSHATTELCLEEIRNCAKHSLGPHFIVSAYN